MTLRRTVLLASILLVAAPAAILAYPWIYAAGAGRLWDRAEHEVHLIPNGYIGPVVILLADPSASPPEREGSARLFRISPSGIARSRLAVNEGWGRPDYYYVDDTGNRTPIVAGTPCDDSLPGDPVQACLLGHTTFSDIPDRSYEAYLVGRRADQYVWGQQVQRFVDSVVYGRAAP